MGPLATLVTSRSTGPMTFTVTPSMGEPLVLVMKSSAVVVAVLEARGRGGCVAGAGLVVVGGDAGGCAVCSKVNSKSATIDLRCYYGIAVAVLSEAFLIWQSSHAHAARGKDRVGHGRGHRWLWPLTTRLFARISGAQAPGFFGNTFGFLPL